MHRGTKGDFLSAVFTRKKKDGNMPTILNLKYLQKHVTYNHFKIESLQDVFKIIQSNCWMASVELKDAFYNVPIHNDHQKYLKFQWLEKLYKFLEMPNGYSKAMHVFTKILCRSHLVMTHIYKVQQKSSVTKMLMQQ